MNAMTVKLYRDDVYNTLIEGYAPTGERVALWATYMMAGVIAAELEFVGYQEVHVLRGL